MIERRVHVLPIEPRIRVKLARLPAGATATDEDWQRAWEAIERGERVTLYLDFSNFGERKA